MYRVVIMGNSGSGKSTMAARLSAGLAIPHLDLDSLAWADVAVRRPVEDSLAMIREFIRRLFDAFSRTKREYTDLGA